MTGEQIMEIFKDTAYIRTGGSPEELRCAEYLLSRCAPFGQAVIEPFAVQMAVNTGIHAVFFEQFGKAAALFSVPKGRKVEHRHDGPPL